MTSSVNHRPDWPTLFLIALCYAVWAWATTVAWTFAPPVALLVTALTVTLFSSIQHEVLHGHPFASRFWNEALVFPAIPMFYPYGRFRDTHLQHHQDESLTDPYDDPESNFMDPAVWVTLPRWAQAVLRFNNTLLGRLTIGPALGTAVFWWGDARAMLRGDRAVIRDWVLHLAGVALILGWLAWVAAMPVWAYLVAAYAGHSVLKIRTFLEHRAHEKARGRTVIIEDRGPLAFLFLNNNLHVVHHTHPKVAWYDLPALYAARKSFYLGKNEGYLYRSYAEVFRRYFLTAKDPVPHPLMPSALQAPQPPSVPPLPPHRHAAE